MPYYWSAPACALINSQRLADDRELVTNSYEAIAAMSELLSTLKDAETGQRGYLLTEDPQYLQPYEMAIARIHADFTRLRERIKSDPAQAARLAGLNIKLNDKLAELKQTVDLTKQGDRAAALELVRSGEGKGLMDDVRGEIIALQEAEQDRLQAQLGRLQSNYLINIVSILLTAAAGIVLVGIVFYLARRGMRQQLRAAAVLTEQKERLRTTLASIGDAVISTDKEGRVTYLNPVAEKLTGWTNATAAGKQLIEVFQIVNETTRQPVDNPALKALRFGTIVGLANHTILIAKDGTEHAIDDSAAPIRCQAGELVGSVLIFRDITERRRTELAVSTSEARKQAILNTSLDGIITIDRQGLILEFNPSAEQMFGYSRGDLIGKEMAELIIPPRYREQHRHGIAHFLKTGAAPVLNQRLELSAIRADGSEFPVELSITRIGPESEPLFTGYIRDITARKKAESDLLERERQFTTLAESIPQLAWIAHPGGHIFWYNRRWYDYTGTTLEQMAGWGWQAVHDPQVLPRVMETWTDSIAAGEPFEMVFPLRGTDGTFRTFLTRAEPIKDEQGQVVRWFGTNTDITEVERVEQQRRETEARWRLALDSAELGTWNIDIATNVLVTDGRFREIFGIAGDSVTYEEAFACIHPDDLERIRDAVAAATRTDNPIPYAAEYRVVHPDGAIRWVFAKGRANFEEGETGVQLQSFDGTVADITERKQAESERIRLASVVENSTDFIAMCDLNSAPFYVNRAGLEMVGLENLEQARRTPVAEFFFPEDRATILDGFFPAVLEDGSGEIEIRFQHFKTGHELWMLYRVFVMKDEHGGPIGLATVSREITERKRLEDDLRHLAADLSEADRRKDEFLATLAHELRNPLAPISNGLHIMRMSSAGGGTVNEMVDQAREMMERQLGQMVRLVDELLDVSRISRGKLDLQTARVDLATVLDNAVETSRPLFEANGHQFEISLPPTPIFVDADAIRLGQVFANLLNNAAKYSDPGSRIRLSAEHQGNDVVVSVTDNGIGIPAEMLSRIFEMFTQVDRSLEKSHGGLGIGLTLVKRLVEMHGGTVAAESAGHGQGSRFIVRLPALLPPSQSSPPVASPLDKTAARKKILVADDNADAATSLAMLLKVMGHETLTARDGQEAVKRAATFQPDIVLLDIGMPRLNGYEACRRIRSLAGGESIVLVALTGWGQDEDKLRSQEAGFNYHLVKPVDHAALKALLADNASAAQ